MIIKLKKLAWWFEDNIIDREDLIVVVAFIAICIVIGLVADWNRMDQLMGKY